MSGRAREGQRRSDGRSAGERAPHRRNPRKLPHVPHGILGAPGSTTPPRSARSSASTTARPSRPPDTAASAPPGPTPTAPGAWYGKLRQAISRSPTSSSMSATSAATSPGVPYLHCVVRSPFRRPRQAAARSGGSPSGRSAASPIAFTTAARRAMPTFGIGSATPGLWPRQADRCSSPLPLDDDCGAHRASPLPRHDGRWGGAGSAPSSPASRVLPRQSRERGHRRHGVERRQSVARQASVADA